MRNSRRVFLSLSAIAIAFCLQAQNQSPSSIGDFDSVAVSHTRHLIDSYVFSMQTLFNEPHSDIDEDSRRYAFAGLFDEAAFLIQDYTVDKDFRNPSQYYHSADKWFRDVNSVYSANIRWDALEMQYFPNDEYYISKLIVDNSYRYIYDKETDQLVESNVTISVLVEMKITQSEKSSVIILTEEHIEPVAAAVEQEVKEDPEFVEDAPTGPKVPEVAKEPKVRIPKNPGTETNDVLLFLSFGLGSDLGLTGLTSESSAFSVKDYSNSSYQASLNLYIPISRNGFYIGAGLGVLSGKLDINYDDANYSFNYADNLNPVDQPGQTNNVAEIDSYRRTASISDLNEVINYQDVTAQVLLSKDLAASSPNGFLFVSGGFSVGLPVFEQSTLTGETNYHGNFTLINGQPANLTLGVNEDIPEYGFERRNTEFEFEFDSNPRFNALLGIQGGLKLGNNFYAGLGIEGLIPLNNWLEGEANHTTVLRTNNDLSESLANTVIQSTRPLRLGISVQLGILF